MNRRSSCAIRKSNAYSRTAALRSAVTMPICCSSPGRFATSRTNRFGCSHRSGVIVSNDWVNRPCHWPHRLRCPLLMRLSIHCRYRRWNYCPPSTGLLACARTGRWAKRAHSRDCNASLITRFRTTPHNEIALIWSALLHWRPTFTLVRLVPDKFWRRSLHRM